MNISSYTSWPFRCLLFFYFFYLFFISWRLITLQYCSGFCQMSSLKKCLVNSNYLNYFSIEVFIFLLLSFKSSFCVCVRTHTCVLSHFSGVQLYAILWTVGHQLPLCMGIVWARIVEWVSMPFSRGSHWPRDRTHGSYVFCIGRWVLYHQCHLGSLYTHTHTHTHTHIDRYIYIYLILYNV